MEPQPQNASPELCQMLFAEVTEGIFISDAQGCFLVVNPAGCELLGYSRAELLQLSWQDLLPGEDFGPGLPGLAEKNNGQTVRTQSQLRGKDGRSCTGEIRLCGLADGRRVALVRNLGEHRPADETQHPYELLATHSRDIILILSYSDGRIMEANASATEIYGYNREELLSLSIQDLRAPETHTLTAAQMAQAQAQGILFETLHRRKDGSTFPVEVNSKGTIINGAPVLISVIRNISERKQVDEALRQSEEKYRQLFSEMSSGCALHEIICDSAGRPVDYITLEVNHAYESLLNANGEAIIGQKASEILPPAELEKWLEIFGPVALTGESTHYEMFSPFNQRHFEGTVYCPEKGNFAVTFADVTERKRAEEALRESENTVRAWLNAIQESAFIVDQAGTILAANATTAQRLHLSLEEMVGASIYDFIPPQNAHTRRLHVAQVIESGQPVRFEDERTGRIFDHLIYPVFDQAGQVKHLAILGTDITEHRQAEEVLRESEAKYRLLAENMADVIWVLNTNSLRFTYVSPSVERLRGYSVAEVMVQPLEQVMTPDSLVQVSAGLPERIRAFLAGDPAAVTQTHEVEQFRKDGSTVWTEGVTTLLRNEAGEIEVLGVSRDISARKQAEKASRLKDELLRLTGEMARVGGWEFDTSTLQGTWTDEVARIHDLDPAQPTNVELGVSFYLPESRQKIDQANKAAIELAQPYDLELEMVSAKGRHKWVRTMGLPITECSRVVKVRGIFQDITERKRAERELHIALEKYRVLFETFPLGISVTDAAGNLLEVNQESERLLGISRKDHTRRTYDGPEWRIIRPDGTFMPPNEFASVRAFKEKRLVENVEMGIVKNDGEITWLSVTAAPIPLEGYGVAIAYGDITERKRAEVALRESEERFRLFMDNSPTTAWIKEDGGCYVYLSQTHKNYFGDWGEDWLGKTDFDLWSPEVAERFRQSDQAVLTAGHRMEFNEEILSLEGSLGTWWTSKFPFQDASGQRYVAGIGLNITERQRTEEALHLTRFSVERAADAIYWLAEEGRIIDINETACRMLGYSREELLQRSAYDIDPAGSPEAWRAVWQRVKQAQTLILERTHQARDGRIIPVEVVANYMEFGGRAFNCTFVRDISERKAAEEARIKLEEQLHQAQKMESIGRLAGGVAHDFNNLLTVILGYSELMQTRLPLSSAALEQLEQIRQSAKRAEGLTRQLLAFSRKQMLVPVVLDLNELITNLRKMLERLIGEDIALTTTLQPDLWWVKVDPGQIEQVIMNLAANARDAMPTGGRLTLETVNVTLKDRLLQTHPETLSGPSIRLTVTDTGHGMDKATQAQIFEPFFTTKEQGKGTGLGLATVYGIIKQSEGEITIASQPGQGTTFTLYLPAHDPVLTGSVVPQPEPVAQPGHETILLVEDEQGVRDLVRMILCDYGYTLLEADHGYQALALAQQEKSIDLLLTDVVMPDINGRELAERIKALHPRIKVLFMSGYTDKEVMRHGVQMAQVEFVAKPFSPVALAAKVREMLDR